MGTAHLAKHLLRLSQIKEMLIINLLKYFYLDHLCVKNLLNLKKVLIVFYLMIQ